MIKRFKCYLQLTKPSIMALVLITGSSALVMEGSLISRPLDFLLVMIALYLTGGCANALNQYFEREIDAKMTRTSRRRPLPLRLISDIEALAFAVAIGIVGVALLYLRFNPLSALLALFTILFYGLFYTLWLKPNTYLNIVIGGAAGAMAPVIGWAAAANSLALQPWLLFLIIFLWTPPHFWALALCLKDDYKKVNLPMLPLVKGDAATITQIYYYTIATVFSSFALVAVNVGKIYLGVAIWFGILFIRKSMALRHSATLVSERGLFRFSIVYIFALFGTITLEGLLWPRLL